MLGSSMQSAAHSQHSSACSSNLEPTLVNQACTLSGRISTPGVSASAAPAVQSSHLRATSTRSCRSALLLLLLPFPGASTTAAAAAAAPAGWLGCAAEALLVWACAVCCARAAAAAGLSSTAGLSNPLAWMILQEHAARQGKSMAWQHTHVYVCDVTHMYMCEVLTRPLPGQSRSTELLPQHPTTSTRAELQQKRVCCTHRGGSCTGHATLGAQWQEIFTEQPLTLSAAAPSPSCPG